MSKEKSSHEQIISDFGGKQGVAFSVLVSIFLLALHVLRSLGAPGWLSQLSVQVSISAQVMIPGSWDPAPEPLIGLYPEHGACLRFSLSCSSLGHTLALSLKEEEEEEEEEEEKEEEEEVFAFLFLKFFLFNVYFWQRERQSTSRGGAEREGDTESETGSRLRGVSTERKAGLEPTNCEIMTWANVGRLTDWATQPPRKLEIL